MLESQMRSVAAMKSLLKANSMCVLATSSDDKPHCSLMAYVTDDEGDTLFFLKSSDLISSKYFIAVRLDGCSPTQSIISPDAGRGLECLKPPNSARHARVGGHSGNRPKSGFPPARQLKEFCQ
jgi:hypothetical protein